MRDNTSGAPSPSVTGCLHQRWTAPSKLHELGMTASEACQCWSVSGHPGGGGGTAVMMLTYETGRSVVV